jgi:hypothetical protein
MNSAEFSGGLGHARCSVQNRTLTVAPARKLSEHIPYKIQRAWRGRSLQQSRVLQYKVAAQAIVVLC